MKKLNHWSSLLVVALSIVAVLQLSVAGQEKSSSSSIEGVWRTAVTPRICSTGVPVGPVFPGILMFIKGGTMTGTSTAVTSVYGNWSKENRPRQYSFDSLSFRFDISGNLLGTRRITHDVTLDDSGNSMVSSGTFQDHDNAGNPTMSGCSTATGVRFQ
ncbi:MAG: hypothetical protein ABI857_12875 [Acidobacteriota bacterium]